MTQLQEYALIENGQIVFRENFKRPELVPSDADWRLIGEETPVFDSSTHRLGEKTLLLLENGTVAYVWSVIELPPPPPPAPPPSQDELQLNKVRAVIAAIAKAADLDEVTVANLLIDGANID